MSTIKKAYLLSTSSIYAVCNLRRKSFSPVCNVKVELLYRELLVRGGYNRYQIFQEGDKMGSLIRKATIKKLSFVKNNGP